VSAPARRAICNADAAAIVRKTTLRSDRDVPRRRAVSSANVTRPSGSDHTGQLPLHGLLALLRLGQTRIEFLW